MKENKPENYPQIGSVQPFARVDQTGQVFQGVGRVVSIYASVDKRIMVQVREGDKAWNVELGMINASPDEVAAYSSALVEIKELENRGNALVKETIDSFNGQCDRVFERLFGPMVDIDPLPVDKAPDGQDHV